MKAIIILLLISGFVFGQVDHNPRHVEAVVDSGDSVISLNIYNTFGANGAEYYKLSGVFTDSTMTSDTLTFKGYNIANESYHEIENEDGSVYTITIEANKYYPLDREKFRGLTRVELWLDAAEAAARTITIVGRVED